MNGNCQLPFWEIPCFQIVQYLNIIIKPTVHGAKRGLDSWQERRGDKEIILSSTFESSLGIWISPRPNVDINRVVISLEKELKLVEQFGVKEEELKIAKNRLIDSSNYTRDSLSGPAYLFGVALSTGQSVSDVEQWSKRISEVTVEQVNSVAREILASQAFVTGVLMPKVKN